MEMCEAQRGVGTWTALTVVETDTIVHVEVQEIEGYATCTDR